MPQVASGILASGRGTNTSLASSFSTGVSAWSPCLILHRSEITFNHLRTTEASDPSCLSIPLHTAIMARLQLYSVFRSINPIRSSPRATLQYTYTRQRRLYAGSSYGGGEGDPKGENPQDQGANPSADLEHPGPPPPSVGEGTGGGPTKKGAEGHNTPQNGGGSGQGSSGGQDGPQPKIHKHDAPKEHTHSDEVKAHNEDMEKRYDRANEKSPDKEENDKVGKGYWSGKWPLRMISHSDPLS